MKPRILREYFFPKIVPYVRYPRRI